ncbi:hypothetical protein [Nocardioides speluncae]|uniref:hypothetical protein n=1 Tax=Nocardioides speluncae TaxID=2670337 RepID=UPI0012B18101|nr:hypothetical protein [Nocardioides speluncae]
MSSPFALPPGPERRAAMREHPLEFNIGPDDYTEDELAAMKDEGDELRAALEGASFTRISPESPGAPA